LKVPMIACAMIAALAAASPALAQNDEIVVTASRYVERNQQAQMPHASIVRRADFVVVQVTVESDTRDLAGRRTELTQTLNEIERRARAGGPVSVALLEESEEDAGETRVKPYSAALALQQMRGGGRPDTSVVNVLLRTPVAEADTLGTTEGRIESFVRGLPKPGRVTLRTDDPQLSVRDPEQYRGQVLAAIAADARQMLDAIGPGHGATIVGLHQRIAWRRTSDLELTLYVPHSISISPSRQ
jgi:hypothetical protein